MARVYKQYTNADSPLYLFEAEERAESTLVPGSAMCAHGVLLA